MANRETINNQKKQAAKKRNCKFWAFFWLAAALALSGWFVFLQVKNRNFAGLKPLLKVLPVGDERRKELAALADIYEKAGGFDREKTFLVLFQNDMELRPGGGFLGSFGIVKTKNGKISDIQVHDTGVFDKNIPDVEPAPEPIAEAFRLDSWKMRDSNWSPDFKTNADRAEFFADLGGLKYNFDGIVAVNTNVLNSILAITGPVKIDNYPGEYSDETAVLQLEYQVEKGYVRQGIEKGERKSIMKEMAETLAKKAHNFTLSEFLELAGKTETHLKRKDIQVLFRDVGLQEQIDALGWSGRVKDFSGDYLMVVDANLNSLKSDVCMHRYLDYVADFGGPAPQAELKITYEHTCRAKDWMTTNYWTWLRVYAPADSRLLEVSGADGEARVSEELGKMVFGLPVYVPIGETKTVTLKYDLPQNISSENYKLLVQKQSGSGDLPIEISLKKENGEMFFVKETLTGDKVLGF